MNFWKLAYNMGWVNAEQLKGAVLTEANRFGEITIEQYKEVTGQEFSTQ